MKLISVTKKSLKEQFRNFWILLLTVSMAPFFICVYYLIIEASKPQYDILILSNDTGIIFQNDNINFGNDLTEAAKNVKSDTLGFPVKVKIINDRQKAIDKLKSKKSDALVVLPKDFSEQVLNVFHGSDSSQIKIEFIGDLTNLNYMISAIWINEIINHYIFEATGKKAPFRIKETSLGVSGSVNDFDMVVPGILILSIIMLMFSASIAFVAEVENKTIIRLKLSKVSVFEYVSGVSIVQIFVGIISIVLTLLCAVGLGFDYRGSLLVFLLITVLTSISIIAFSLLLAAVTKTVNEILIFGNFPLFLFMFFTGVAFPIKGKELFSIADYSISLQGLMSPTHAISALNKIMIMEMNLPDILPEIITLLALTLIYFVIGVLVFRWRHMRVV